MIARRPLIVLRHALCGLLAAAPLALGACGGDGESAGNPDSELTLEQATAPLDSASPELVELRDQANELLPGGREAFEARLSQLRGHPVVVNKWASWCSPCRFEFPFMQSQAIKRAGEVAFLGVDSGDSDEAARTFLSELPLPYPSYSDPEHEIADLLEAREFPATVFYDSKGERVYVHLGAYRDEQQLAADIERYAR
jgi:cytochrome c biogenesis protein CcmG, thiol:disulfide interchange protein DsbE